MRPQRAWLRICALLALISLVLPASARVVSCMDHAKGMTCCMAKAAKPKTQPTHDCCGHENKPASATPVVSEGKSACHCVLKTLPTKSANVFTLYSPSEQVEFNIPAKTADSTVAEPTSGQTKTVFYTDSSPPSEPPGSSNKDRAPPVSVPSGK